MNTYLVGGGKLFWGDAMKERRLPVFFPLWHLARRSCLAVSLVVVVGGIDDVFAESSSLGDVCRRTDAGGRGGRSGGGAGGGGRGGSRSAAVVLSSSSSFLPLPQPNLLRQQLKVLGRHHATCHAAHRRAADLLQGRLAVGAGVDAVQAARAPRENGHHCYENQGHGKRRHRAPKEPFSTGALVVVGGGVGFRSGGGGAGRGHPGPVPHPGAQSLPGLRRLRVGIVDDWGFGGGGGGRGGRGSRSVQLREVDSCLFGVLRGKEGEKWEEISV